jgi:hypothetical protein
MPFCDQAIPPDRWVNAGTSFKYYTVKKTFRYSRPPAGMSVTKLFLGGNNDVIYKLFPQSLVIDIPAGDGNIEKLFLRCSLKIEIQWS